MYKYIDLAMWIFLTMTLIYHMIQYFKLKHENHKLKMKIVDNIHLAKLKAIDDLIIMIGHISHLPDPYLEDAYDDAAKILWSIDEQF